MHKLGCLTLCFGFAVVAVMVKGQDRPDFSGTWQLDPAKCELHNMKVSDASWSIQESADTIDLTEKEGGKAIEVKCSTEGKECSVNGEKAKASFWYNGTMLVEMETKGDHVTRYRLKLSPDGKTLRVETNFLVPQTDGTDVLVFNKKS
jgi:hypothetical protein